MRASDNNTGWLGESLLFFILAISHPLGNLCAESIAHSAGWWLQKIVVKKLYVASCGGRFLQRRPPPTWHTGAYHLNVLVFFTLPKTSTVRGRSWQWLPPRWLPEVTQASRCVNAHVHHRNRVLALRCMIVMPAAGCFRFACSALLYFCFLRRLRRGAPDQSGWSKPGRHGLEGVTDICSHAMARIRAVPHENLSDFHSLKLLTALLTAPLAECIDDARKGCAQEVMGRAVLVPRAALLLVCERLQLRLSRPSCCSRLHGA